MVIRSGFGALQKCVCRMSGGPLLCVVFFMVHTYYYDGLRCVFVIYCVWGVGVLFIVHKCDGGGVCSSYIVCDVLSFAVLFCVPYM